MVSTRVGGKFYAGYYESGFMNIAGIPWRRLARKCSDEQRVQTETTRGLRRAEGSDGKDSLQQTDSIDRLIEVIEKWPKQSQSQLDSHRPITHSRRPADEVGDVEVRPSPQKLGRIGLPGYEVSRRPSATTRASLGARSGGRKALREVSEPCGQCPSKAHSSHLASNQPSAYSLLPNSGPVLEPFRVLLFDSLCTKSESERSTVELWSHTPCTIAATLVSVSRSSVAMFDDTAYLLQRRFVSGLFCLDCQ
ncbi:hypothetical protein DFP72DRAFT_284928 [Ephemerocybe angulata]|uniref:Uncharacterized protein n=1 Tax=Ephemerocybe angulata TaxID=980116 RepID=A0A8H6M9U5_9AGAR|nr:hypothetical protein DFP72DRAFT_284928 [Tulosesus angulatus]